MCDANHREIANHRVRHPARESPGCVNRRPTARDAPRERVARPGRRECAMRAETRRALTLACTGGHPRAWAMDVTARVGVIPV
jgi:hypothetical protein